MQLSSLAGGKEDRTSGGSEMPWVRADVLPGVSPREARELL